MEHDKSKVSSSLWFMEAFERLLDTTPPLYHVNLTDELVPPNPMTQAPNYSIKGVWVVAWLVVVEYLALWLQGARLPSLHHNVLSLVHATLHELCKICVRGVEFSVYVWLWRYYSILSWFKGDLSTPSIVATVLIVDFFYYWLHRASHEIMVLWAIHQVHHSSEELTFSVGIRHSPLQRLFTWVFYLPLAFLGLHPHQMAAHMQINTLFQTWVHTTSIGSLGPFEYLFNTPKHHRVHHGSNKYCLDVNYGGILILWDRLFGTYQDEIKEIPVVYGIVVQPDKYEPIYHQWFYLAYALEKARSMTSWSHFFSALLKGPSWLPGLKWTGDEREKPEEGPREQQPVHANVTLHIYVILHLLATLTLTTYLTTHKEENVVLPFAYGCLVVAALSCIGVLYEGRPCMRAMEACRNIICLLLCWLLPLTPAGTLTTFLLVALYATSTTLWLFGTIGPKMKKVKRS